MKKKMKGMSIEDTVVQAILDALFCQK